MSEKKTDTGDMIVKIVERAHDEIVWVRSAYKFVVVIVSVLIAIGLFFSYNSFRDLKTDLKEDGKHIQQTLKGDIALLGRSLQQNLTDETLKMHQEVTARIDQEFNKEDISRLVQTKAKERIDDIADKLIAAETSRRILPLKEDLTQIIRRTSDDTQKSITAMDRKMEQSQKTERDLQTMLLEAQKTLAELKIRSEFISATAAAQADDRAAYEQLVKWAADKSFPLNEQAWKMYRAVQAEYWGERGQKNWRVIDWVPGKEPNKLTAAELKQAWQNVSSDSARDFVNCVWIHPELTKEEKLTFLHEIISDSHNSLHAADAAARLLAEEAKIAYNPPFDFSQIETWWAARTTNQPPERAANKTLEATPKPGAPQ